MSDTPPPPPARAPAGRLPFGMQVALGFFGPGVVAIGLALAAAGLTHGTKNFLAQAGAGFLCFGVWGVLVLWLVQASGKSGWRGVRLGLILLVAVGVLWVAGCFGLARLVFHH